MRISTRVLLAGAAALPLAIGTAGVARAEACKPSARACAPKKAAKCAPCAAKKAKCAPCTAKKAKCAPCGDKKAKCSAKRGS
mgnify:CR=1 FL=1